MLSILSIALVLAPLMLAYSPIVYSDEITIAKPTFRSVRFVDQKIGWIAGHAGVFRTTDGGRTWERQPIRRGPIPRTISRAGTENTGLIGWVDLEGAIIRYDDSLVLVSNGVKEPGILKPQSRVLEDIYALSFTDREVGWGVSPQGLRRTTDGGATWSLLGAAASRMTAIYPLSRNELWAVGDLSAVQHSYDGGESWVSQSLYRGMSQYGGTAEFLAVHFADSGRGWVSGTDGLVFHSADGGRTWQRQETPFTRFTALSAISFIDDKEGWIAGSTYLDNKYRAVILHTEDGGGHWTSQIEGISDRLLDVQGLANGRAWAVGVSGTVLRTDDHGKTWFSIKP